MAYRLHILNDILVLKPNIHLIENLPCGADVVLLTQYHHIAIKSLRPARASRPLPLPSTVTRRGADNNIALMAKQRHNHSRLLPCNVRDFWGKTKMFQKDKNNVKNKKLSIFIKNKELRQKPAIVSAQHYALRLRKQFL